MERRKHSLAKEYRDREEENDKSRFIDNTWRTHDIICIIEMEWGGKRKRLSIEISSARKIFFSAEERFSINNLL
jgi:hypothetical protein